MLAPLQVGKGSEPELTREAGGGQAWEGTEGQAKECALSPGCGPRGMKKQSEVTATAHRLEREGERSGRPGQKPL